MKEGATIYMHIKTESFVWLEDIDWVLSRLCLWFLLRVWFGAGGKTLDCPTERQTVTDEMQLLARFFFELILHFGGWTRNLESTTDGAWCVLSDRNRGIWQGQGQWHDDGLLFFCFCWWSPRLIISRLQIHRETEAPEEWMMASWKRLQI